MKTLTMKLPDELAAWVESQSSRGNQSKSGFIRAVLAESQTRGRRSALDMAGDLCGCVASGRRDLSRNRKYLKGFGK
jgi:hypothetical protein